MAKKSKLKFLACSAALSLAVGFAAVFGGCFSTAGRDGINGKDLNIYDIYEAAKTESGNSSLTMEEFLKEYLSYNSSELEEATSLKAAINRSLMSGVSILANFRERENGTYENKSYFGSGVILDVDIENGDMVVLTNCHVVYSAKANVQGVQNGYSNSITCWLYGNEDFETGGGSMGATIIAASKTYDAALLSVKNSDVVKKSKAVAATWAGGEENYLGETVYAIGNPKGKKLSANVGYISKDLEKVAVDLGANNRPEEFEYNVIRSSVDVNSGNSGGGLFNASGELVGLVNSRSADSDMTGAGYALTGAVIRRVVARMLAEYDGENPVYGVNTLDHGIYLKVSDSYSTGLNDKGLAELREDTVVYSVDGLSKSWDKIEIGDQIKNVKIKRVVNGETVTVEDADILREHNFYDVMLAVAPDDTVEFTIVRDGALLEEPVSVVYSGSDFSLAL